MASNGFQVQVSPSKVHSCLDSPGLPPWGKLIFPLVSQCFPLLHKGTLGDPGRDSRPLRVTHRIASIASRPDAPGDFKQQATAHYREIDISKHVGTG